MNYRKGFTLLELLVVIAIIGLLSTVILPALNQSRAKSRDSIRISQIRQITYALELYYDKFGSYPPCLQLAGCGGNYLQNQGFIPSIPTDPLTGLSYTYVATGVGPICNGYHIGASLEDISNKALITDSDAPAVGVCNNSNPNFNGLSIAAGGQLCNNISPGSPQPGGTETCYDRTN